MHEDILYQIALTYIHQIGPVNAKILISYCGSAKAVFQTSKEKLEKIPGIGPQKVQNIFHKDLIHSAEKEFNYIVKHNIEAISFLDSKYPQRLKNQEDAPVVLFKKGNADLNPPRTVGIIGTRSPTENGRIITQKIVNHLAAYNVTIISGLAYGIDACAHKASLDAKLPTIGLLGNGLDKVYPSEHRGLQEKMIEHDGALVTEFNYETGPDRQNFPMRNRLIAAMSDALIVIESKEKGGSIITAEYANEYNKDVFAVPGRTTDEYSAGCNGLIKKHKAYLLESAKDLLYIMRWDDTKKHQAVQTSLFLDLTDQEKIVYDFIVAAKESHIDDMAYQLQMPIGSLSSLLLTLEFKGTIVSFPGKRYKLI